MGVLLARSECRGGFWHVVTYDLSDPDNWKEVGDIETTQECSVDLQIAFQETPAPGGYEGDDRQFVAIHRELTEREHSSVLISPAGHAVALAHGGDGFTSLTHCDERGETVQTVCSGSCKKADGTVVTVGPKPCPSGNGGIDCTTDPPTLICR